MVRVRTRDRIASHALEHSARMLRHLESCRWQYLICLVTAVLICSENPLLYAMTTLGYWMTIMAALMLVILPRFPRTCSGIIVLLFVVADVLPSMYATTFFFAQFVAIGVLAYRERGMYPVLLAMSTVLAISCSAIMYALPTVGGRGCAAVIINHSLYSCSPMFVGRAFNWRERASQSDVFRLKMKQMELDRQYTQQRLMMASRIHDAITGNMVRISLLAEQAMISEHANEKNMVTLNIINDTALQTLNDTRAVIRLMRQETSSSLDDDSFSRNMSPFAGDAKIVSTDAIAGDVVSITRELMREQHAYLDQLGYRGNVTVEESAFVSASSMETVAELKSLIKEIFTNIIRHADRKRGYEVHTIFQGDMCHIMQSNFINPGHYPNGGINGQGLMRHRMLIEATGGRFVHFMEDDEWMLMIDLPLHIACATGTNNPLPQ